MLELDTLTIRNYLSIGNVTQVIQLNRPGITVVAGRNLDRSDDDDTSRNGAGKTTFLNALSYVITGQPITSIRLDNLINNDNGKNMLVTLDFRRDQHAYRIERGRRPNVFRLLVDSKEVTAPSTLEDETQGVRQDTQTMIDNVVGLTPVLFRLIMALTTYADPFFKQPAARQREIVEEIFNITLLSEKAERLREILNGSVPKNITGTRNEIKNEEFRIRTMQESNTRLERTISEIKFKHSQWEKQRTTLLSDLKQQLADFSAIDFDAELERFAELEAYREKTRSLLEDQRILDAENRRVEMQITHLIEKADLHRKQIRDIKGDEHLRDIQRYQRDITDTERRLADAQDEHQKLLADLDTSDELVCKTCGQRLSDTDHLEQVVQQIRRSITAVEARIATMEDNKRSLQEAAQQVAEQAEQNRQKLTEDNEQHRHTAAEIEAEALRMAGDVDDISRRKTALTEQLASMGKTPTTIFASKEEIWQAKSLHEKITSEFEHHEQSVNPYEDQITSLEASMQVISHSELNRLIDKKEHEEFLLKMLSDKNSFIRKAIIEQNLAYLNHRLSTHLEEVGLPHEVSFMSDLTVEINRNGKTLDFDNLSRGEQNRLLLSLSWAFRDLFENMHIPMNALFIDEVLDFGMDSQGVDAALAALKGMYEDRGKSVFVISNREDIIAKGGSVLYAIKENDFTTYEPMEVV